MTRLIPLGLAALVLAVAAPTALATEDEEPAASLAGETLTASETGGGTSDVQGTCNLLGPSTFTFTVTGTAIGPYPGTFVESGTFTIGGPPTFGLTSFNSSFEITSVNGTVTGSKALAPTQPGTFVGVCGAATGLLPAGPDATSIQAQVTYTAQVGSSTESGEANVTLQDTEVRGVPDGNGFSFLEVFEGGVPVCEEDSNGQGDEDCDSQGENEQ